MMDCILEKIGEGRYRCTRDGCGRVIEFDHDGPIDELHFRCHADPAYVAPPDLFGVSEKRSAQDAVDLQEGAEHLGLTPDLVSRWAASVIRWNRAGRPKRTDKQVAACLRVCTGNDDNEPCEHYRTTWLGGRCAKCGCCVNESSIAVRNKVRMATEDCPGGKWPKDGHVAPAATTRSPLPAPRTALPVLKAEDRVSDAKNVDTRRAHFSRAEEPLRS